MCHCRNAVVTMLLDDRLRVKYTGGIPIDLIGPRTQAVYRFSGRTSEQLMDPRDVNVLRRHRHFHIVGVVSTNR